MQRISQTLKVILALFVATFSNGLLPAAQASAYSMDNPGGDFRKVYVCKYVGTPGQDERLQTGDNPISVSVNAISNFQGLGSYFNDAHGRSYVVAWDNGDHREPPVSMCPSPTASIPVPATPSVNDLCGSGNATWVVPTDTTQIDWTLRGNGDLVADTKSGYVFNDQTTTHNYGKAVDSNTSCTTVIPVPATPNVDDPCGSHNAKWIVPDDTVEIDWTLNANGDLVATTKNGYEFATGNKNYHNYGKAVDSNIPCVTVIPVPNAPEPKDPCGLHNAQWIVPHDTFQIDWSVNGKGELIAATKTGFIFPDNEHSHNFGKAEDSGKLCPVKPEVPKFIDYCGERTDYVVIPSVRNVLYKINGKVVHDGSHAVSGTVTVTAQPAHEDYTLVGEDLGPWTHVFADTDCVTVTKSSQPVTDTNGDGTIGVGDKVTWNITVTNNSDNDLDNFKIELTDSTATIVNDDNVTDGVIKYLKHGTSVVLTATSTLTVDEVKACKATNVVEFQGWYARKHHKLDENGRENYNSSFKHGDYDDEEEGYDLSGSAKAEATFTCPTPGSGSSGGSSDATTVSVTSETPETLPATGPSDNNPLLILAGSAVAYIATYMIQRRRELAARS